MESDQMLYKALSNDLSGKGKEAADRYSRRIAVFSDSPENLEIGEIQLKSVLWGFLDEAVSGGICTLFTGLSYGADSAAAELFTEKKRETGEIRIVHVPARSGRNPETPVPLRGFAAGSFARSVDFSKEITGPSVLEAKMKRDRFIIDQCLHIVFVLDFTDENESSYVWELLEYSTHSHKNAISHNIHVISCGRTPQEQSADEPAGRPVQDSFFQFEKGDKNGKLL